ncbi:MAG TPA: hypothetical protein VEF34_00480 [Syntrophobacteraceae bacterium]|nr:hypothetical protein [Syntrophobacteraceae bacterium]
MRTMSIRIPEELAEWLRVKAAQKTIQRKKYVSINVLVAEIFRREMEADQRKER